MTDPPSTMTYVSVVSRETVSIDFTLAALNDLPVNVADIQNEHIMVPVTENIWTVLGPEYGEDAGRKAVLVRALYDLKSAGAAFWNHFEIFMHNLGFLPCPADLYLWIKHIGYLAGEPN